MKFNVFCRLHLPLSQRHVPISGPEDAGGLTYLKDIEPNDYGDNRPVPVSGSAPETMSVHECGMK